MKIIAFAASNSRQSINRKLASYAASLIKSADIDLLDLNDFEMPLFSQDKEAELGQPEQAKQFLARLQSADALIISFAEHNGSYTAAYKNIFDWVSRIEQKVFQNKPMVMLSTSPGPRGASSVLALATNSAHYFAGDVKASLSVPRFFDNFDVKKQCLLDDDLLQKLEEALAHLPE
jgi:NAD(P)H-dependent FMN reductase